MTTSIMKVPFDAYSKTPTDYFAICGENGMLRPDVVLRSKEDSMNIPDKCTDKTTPSGLFFVQPEKNSQGAHVIARGMLTGLFVDDNFNFACSGYAQKVLKPESRVIVKEPKLLCVAPKEGATKAGIKRTIEKLDTAFNIGFGFNTNKYMQIVKESFDTKRWNLESKRDKSHRL